MPSFDTLIMQDVSDRVRFEVCSGDVILPHGLDKEDTKIVSSLFATAALVKFLRIDNEKNDAIDEELRRILGQ